MADLEGTKKHQCSRCLMPIIVQFQSEIKLKSYNIGKTQVRILDAY